VEVIQKMHRRYFSAWATASMLLGSTALMASPVQQRVSIALAAKGSLFHLPVMLADQLGIFKHDGIQIDWIECESGLQAVNAAVSGSAEVVSGAFEHILDLQARGLNFRAFVMQSRTPQISLGVSHRRAQAMKSVADLKSLKMGVSSLGSATHWVAQHWMRQSGVSPEAVQFVELGGSTSAVMEAMKMGSIDSLCYVDPIVHYLEQKGDLRVIADTRTLSTSQRMFGGAMVSSCLFAKDDFLKKRPEAAHILAQGVVRALHWLKTAGPTDILRSVPSPYWMGDRAVYLGALDKVRDSYSFEGAFSKEALENAWRARANRVTTDRSNFTTLDRSYTNEFVKTAKRKSNV
jgi:NitT/TauT family transport system substrate-binding protein